MKGFVVRFLLVAVGLLTTARRVEAVSNFTETFSVDASNWRTSNTNILLTWVSDGGPAGAGDGFVSGPLVFTGLTDNATAIFARGHSNTPVLGFAGNWLADGILYFRVDVRHQLPTNVSFGVRLATRANSPAVSVTNFTPVVSNTWTTLTVPIFYGSPDHVLEGSPATTFSNTFKGLGNVQIFIKVPPGYGGAPLTNSFDLDNPGLVAASGTAEQGSLSNAVPTYDRWMYPFNASSPPGSRPLAPTFGTLDPDFDERDGQFYFAFALSNQVPAGLGPESYEILSARVRATVSDGDVLYDATADSHVTYLSTNNGLYQADADAGRPMELFGAGFRGGFDAVSFGEDGPYAPPGTSGYRHARTVYPLGFTNGTPVDASVHVDPDGENGLGSNGFDVANFAIGQATLAPGDAVTSGTGFTFDLNPLNPEVLAYLQDGLDQGLLSFVIATLHGATFGGETTYPVWDNKENLVGQPAALELTYRLHPRLAVALDDSAPPARLSWSSAVPGFALEAVDSLTNSAIWQGIATASTSSGGVHRVVLPLDRTRRSFRLVKP